MVDDGSTDDSALIASRFGSPVRCIVQQNAGQSAARNHGVRASRGDVIAFLDCDDLIHPTKIERQLRRFAAAPELMFIDAYAQNFWSPEIPESERRLLGWQALTHSARPWPQFIGTWLLRRPLWELVGGFDENRRFAEDSDWHDRRDTAVCPLRQCVWCLPGVDCITPISRGTITTATSTACSDSTRRELPATAPKERWAERSHDLTWH